MLKDITYLDDYKLVDEYISGNTDSGKILYAKVYEKLPGYVYNYTAKSILTEEDRDEIIEETLVESVEKICKYNGKCQFTTFVLGFAKNKCREKIRKNNNITVIEIDEEKIADEDYNYYNQDPAIIIIKKEEIEKINMAMNKLQTEDKQIIQLRAIKGITAKKIGELTGENIEAIYSRYRRAVKKFKKIMKKCDQFFEKKTYINRRRKND